MRSMRRTTTWLCSLVLSCSCAELSSGGCGQAISLRPTVAHEHAESAVPVPEDARGLEPVEPDPAAPGRAEQKGRDHLIAVGIDSYESLPKLSAAANDANAVADRMELEGYRVTRLLNGEATRSAIVAELHRALDFLREDDRLLLYFAGHGVSVGGAERPMGYLQSVEVHEGRPFDGIAMSELQSILQSMRSDKVMFVADACYSGLALESHNAIDAQSRNRLRHVMVAGEADQQAWERGTQGLFSDYFLQAINGAADSNHDRFVRSHEAFSFVVNGVRTASNDAQVPQQVQSGEGSYDFAVPASTKTEECKPGQVRDRNSAYHCCWPGQAWHLDAASCVGKPDCPTGMFLVNDECRQAKPVAGRPGMTMAARKYEAGCVAGNGRDCSDLGMLAGAGAQGIPRDLQRAIQEHEKGCRLGSAVACRRAAQYWSAESGATARRKALEYGALACDAADGRGCLQLAAVQLELADAAQAEQALKRGCDVAASGESCEVLGTLYENGAPGVAVNAQLALASFEKACTSGQAQCAALSRLYGGGKIVEQDDKKAAELSGRACDAGDAQGCYQLARALESGKGIAKDLEAAKALKLRACSAGIGDACLKPGAEPTKRKVPSDASGKFWEHTPKLIDPAALQTLQDATLKQAKVDCAANRGEAACAAIPALSVERKVASPKLQLELQLKKGLMGKTLPRDAGAPGP